MSPSSAVSVVRPPLRVHRGFTLIELVIAVGLVAILAAIAIPSYNDHVNRSRRTAAKATLAEAAQWMERFRAENNGVYTGAALPATLTVSPPGASSPMYDVTLTGVTAVAYELNAVPRTGTPMASDACATMTLASDGRRTAAGAGTGAVFEKCWLR